MAYKYITTAAVHNVSGGKLKRCAIQVNKALTGTLTVYDATDDSANTIAVIENPTVGSRYEYWWLKNGFTVKPSATCDITAMAE